MTLVPVDTSNALAVSDYLDRAKQWLSTAVEMTGPHEIAMARAEIATAAEAARQLNLSKDIRDDATEMVRRAEYAVSRSIRKGQEEGTVRTRGQRGSIREGYERTRFGSVEHVQADAANSANNLPGPSDIAPDYSSNGGELRELGLVNPDEFEVALEEAKAEGNLSRANLVRKVKGDTSPQTRDQRADLIRELADKGYSSRQMPSKVGVSEETCREIARAYGISIPADKALNRGRRIDWTDAVTQTVVGLENSVEFLENQIDLTEVDFSEADEWVSSLTNSIRALNRFVKQIKEQTHV